MKTYIERVSQATQNFIEDLELLIKEEGLEGKTFSLKDPGVDLNVTLKTPDEIAKTNYSKNILLAMLTVAKTLHEQEVLHSEKNAGLFLLQTKITWPVKTEAAKAFELVHYFDATNFMEYDAKKEKPIERQYPWVPKVVDGLSYKVALLLGRFIEELFSIEFDLPNTLIGNEIFLKKSKILMDRVSNFGAENRDFCINIKKFMLAKGLIGDRSIRTQQSVIEEKATITKEPAQEKTNPEQTTTEAASNAQTAPVQQATTLTSEQVTTTEEKASAPANSEPAAQAAVLVQPAAVTANTEAKTADEKASVATIKLDTLPVQQPAITAAVQPEKTLTVSKAANVEAAPKQESAPAQVETPVINKAQVPAGSETNYTQQFNDFVSNQDTITAANGKINQLNGIKVKANEKNADLVELAKEAGCQAEALKAMGYAKTGTFAKLTVRFMGRDKNKLIKVVDEKINYQKGIQAAANLKIEAIHQSLKENTPGVLKAFHNKIKLWKPAVAPKIEVKPALSLWNRFVNFFSPIARFAANIVGWFKGNKKPKQDNSEQSHFLTPILTELNNFVAAKNEISAIKFGILLNATADLLKQPEVMKDNNKSTAVEEFLRWLCLRQEVLGEPKEKPTAEMLVDAGLVPSTTFSALAPILQSAGKAPAENICAPVVKQPPVEKLPVLQTAASLAATPPASPKSPLPKAPGGPAKKDGYTQPPIPRLGLVRF